MARTAYHAFDVESGGSLGKADFGAFADKLVRAGFMRKVFGLLSVQLALTTVMGGFIVFSPAVKAFLHGNPGILMVSILATFGILLAFAFSEKARNSHPTNLVLLFAFTVCEGLLVGAISSRYRTDLVLLAFAMTAAVSTGLSVYAMRTKQDFTTMGGCLYAMLLSMMVASLLGMFVHIPMFKLVMGLAGAGLFSMYLMHDIQLLMGGDHTHKLSPDDYVMGAITLYLDIINIFIHILQVLNETRRE